LVTSVAKATGSPGASRPWRWTSPAAGAGQPRFGQGARLHRPGRRTEVGAAWKASDTSGALLNVKLDDPSWPEPANVRLMAAENGVLPMTWIRKSENPDKPAPPPPPE
jgi:hypothetical protein